jgi:antitoxin ParD1/3/4
MPKVAKRTFSLPADQAAYIDAQVQLGAYVSDSELVRAGLRALQDRDSDMERWLKEEVVPAYDAMKADTKHALPAQSVFAEVRARYTKRKGHH